MNPRITRITLIEGTEGRRRALLSTARLSALASGGAAAREGAMFGWPFPQFAQFADKLGAPLVALVLLSLALVQTTTAQTNTTSTTRKLTLEIPHSPPLQGMVARAVEGALERFAPQNLGTNQIAVTLVDLLDPAKPVQAGYRGGDQIYPASVIKLFYLVAVHRWMENGKLKDTEELRRAMHDIDRKSTRLNSSHRCISYAVFCLKK